MHGKLDIIFRSGVGGISEVKNKRKWKEIIIHHTWKPTGIGKDGKPILTRKYADEINRAHIIDRGWNEMGYHFLINPNGIVQYGDRWLEQHAGAHCVGHNLAGIGISFVGNFDVNYPTIYQMETLYELVAELLYNNFMAYDYEVHYHREFAHKTCPGSQFPDFIKQTLMNT